MGDQMCAGVGNSLNSYATSLSESSRESSRPCVALMGRHPTAVLLVLFIRTCRPCASGNRSLALVQFAQAHTDTSRAKSTSRSITDLQGAWFVAHAHLLVSLGSQLAPH